MPPGSGKTVLGLEIGAPGRAPDPHPWSHDRDLGLIAPDLGPDHVLVVPQPDGYYRAYLDDASTETRRGSQPRSTRSMSPLWDPRWIVPRRVAQPPGMSDTATPARTARSAEARRAWSSTTRFPTCWDAQGPRRRVRASLEAVGQPGSDVSAGFGPEGTGGARGPSRRRPLCGHDADAYPVDLMLRGTGGARFRLTGATLAGSLLAGCQLLLGAPGPIPIAGCCRRVGSTRRRRGRLRLRCGAGWPAQHWPSMRDPEGRGSVTTLVWPSARTRWNESSGQIEFDDRDLGRSSPAMA